MRGYPHRLVSSALICVNKLSQIECMISKKENMVKDALYCIIEFNSTNPLVRMDSRIMAYFIQEFWYKNSHRPRNYFWL